MANKVYVVFKGRSRGVFYSWDKVLEATRKWPGNKHKSYQTKQEAWDAWNHFRETGETPY